MELIEFEWLRPIDGCAFHVTPTGQPRRASRKRGWITPAQQSPGLETAGPRRFGFYRPAEFPALVQRFADVPATADGIRGFLNNYGPLELAGSGPPRDGALYLATDLRAPLAHHAALRAAIDLFSSGDLPALAARFNASWGQLRTELRPRPGGNVGIVFVPSSLIQFLWLQFALHAASDTKLLRCDHCSAPFRVGTGTGRRDTAKFCSNACKVAAFRGRHKREASHA